MAMANTFGESFRITTFGESHGIGVGAVVDGCPSRLALTEADIQPQLDRRRPGQSDLTTSRGETDRVEILSGVEGGLTLGTPIALLIRNRDARTGDYDGTAQVPRPSHADFTYKAKYGISARGGGGRASARETVGRVAGGAIAEKWLAERFGVRIVAWVSSVGDVDAPDLTNVPPAREVVDRTPVRCPDAAAAARMIAEIKAVRDAKDSVGGTITCVAVGVPAGWGEPVFDKVGARLAAAMLSLPACKGFEIGSGFAGTRMRGSAHNDVFARMLDGGIAPRTNRAGGTLGGITSGAPIVFRVAFKPVATIGLPQETVDYAGRPVTFRLEKGRHDPCVAPRAVPIVEAMAALVLADLALAAR
jgi:chorismate synthase